MKYWATIKKETDLSLLTLKIQSKYNIVFE